MALQLCIYLRQYWAALAITVVGLGVFGTMTWYLVIRFAWYRRWLAWVALVGLVTTALALATKVIWWAPAPIAFVFLSKPLFERDLRELGEVHGVPPELGEEEPLPKDSWGQDRQD